MFRGLGFRIDDLGFRVDVLSLDQLTLYFFFVKVNQKVINVIYPSLKMRVNVISINMKSGILKMVFLAVFQTKVGLNEAQSFGK